MLDKHEVPGSIPGRPTSKKPFALRLLYLYGFWATAATIAYSARHLQTDRAQVALRQFAELARS
jgi:hypothetical protein